MAMAYATPRATVDLGGSRDSSEEIRPNPITSARLGSSRRLHFTPEQTTAVAPTSESVELPVDREEFGRP